MKTLIFAGLILISTFVFGQIGQHTVQPKETVYGISQQYNITQEELIQANPFLNERVLMIGDVLNIPGLTTSTQNILETPNVSDYEDESFQYINIQPKETLYSLSKKYDISQDQLKSLNPFIEERGLQIGDIIRLPKKNTTDENPTSQIVVPEGMHLVQSGETVYSIAKLYGLEMSDIYTANREIQTEGLKKGSFIKIPKEKSIKTTITKSTQSFEYKVEKGETIFSILRKYDITLEELIAANPQLENGLQEGMILQIPVAKGAVLEEEPVLVDTNTDNFSDKEINIALILPFFLDNTSKNKGERQIAQDFYIGAQVALKELIKKGKTINLEIVDSQNNKKKLQGFLESNKMNKIDAIVGPFYQDLVAYTAQKVQSTEIPVFSPVISSPVLEQYKNVYMATPRDEYAANIIVDEMAEAYNGTQTVKILTTTKEKVIAKYLSDKFKLRFPGAEILITKNPTDFNLVEHKETVTDSNGEIIENITYDPILAVLASENNTLGHQFVNVIKKQNAEDITGFSIYFVPALDVFDTSNIENINALKEMGFTYTAIQMVNTFGAREKKILKSFQDNYCTVPNKYMSIGYDVVYDVIDRMNTSGKISEFDAKRSETRLSSKYGYNNVEGIEAQINKELRVIRLKK